MTKRQIEKTCVICQAAYVTHRVQQFACASAACLTELDNRVRAARAARDKDRIAGRQEAREAKKAEVPACLECGATYQRTSPNQVTCLAFDCQDKRVKAQRTRYRERVRGARTIYSKTCVVCSAPFETPTPARLCCSQGCALSRDHAKKRAARAAWHAAQGAEMRASAAIVAGRVTVKRGAAREIACGGCTYGVRSSASEFGFECRLQAAMRCSPLSGAKLLKPAVVQ